MCIFHGKNGYITLHLFMFVLSQDAIFLALFPKKWHKIYCCILWKNWSSYYTLTLCQVLCFYPQVHNSVVSVSLSTALLGRFVQNIIGECATCSIACNAKFDGRTRLSQWTRRDFARLWSTCEWRVRAVAWRRACATDASPLFPSGLIESRSYVVEWD